MNSYLLVIRWLDNMLASETHRLEVFQGNLYCRLVDFLMIPEVAVQALIKLDGVGPVDNRPSTD